MSKSRQVILGGSGNQQANGDIINITVDAKIEFYEKDLKKVIEYFDENLNNIKIEEVFNDLKKIPLDKKNRLNNLSEEYFEIIVMDYMEYFNKIDAFLKDPINVIYLKMYKSTVEELKRKVVIYRKRFDKFEEIFDVLYNYMINQSKEKLQFNRQLIWVFLHYMYCKCHIGKKEENDYTT